MTPNASNQRQKPAAPEEVGTTLADVKRFVPRARKVFIYTDLGYVMITKDSLRLFGLGAHSDTYEIHSHIDHDRRLWVGQYHFRR